VTDPELDQVVAAIRGGKQFSIRGMDGEWGYSSSGDGRFVLFRHFPYQDTPDQLVGEDTLRRDLAPFPLDTVLARLR
jgi:hypothetical protein